MPPQIDEIAELASQYAQSLGGEVEIPWLAGEVC